MLEATHDQSKEKQWKGTKRGGRRFLRSALVNDEEEEHGRSCEGEKMGKRKKKRHLVRIRTRRGRSRGGGGEGVGKVKKKGALPCKRNLKNRKEITIIVDHDHELSSCRLTFFLNEKKTRSKKMVQPPTFREKKEDNRSAFFPPFFLLLPLPPALAV